MSEVIAAAEGLSRARAAFETRPNDERCYVAVLELEVRLLRAENRELRQERAAFERERRQRARRVA